MSVYKNVGIIKMSVYKNVGIIKKCRYNKNVGK